MKMSAVIGHRGAAKVAPENTLSGIRAAHNAGINWVEMDVVLLGDGGLVMHHDRTLERCTSGHGELLQKSLGDIQSLDAGVVFAGITANPFRNEPIPTLQQTLDLLEQLDMGINLEIKMHLHGVDDLVVPVLDVLRNQNFPKDKLIISSFDHGVLKRCFELLPEVPRAHLFGAIPDDWLQQTREVDAITVHVDQKPLKKVMAREVIDQGYELYCYTVNSGKRAAELIGWGVSGVFTDDPSAILKALH